MGTPTVNDEYLETLRELAFQPLDNLETRLKLREGIRGAVSKLEVDLGHGTALINFRNIPEVFSLTVGKDGFTAYDGEGTPLNLESRVGIELGKRQGWITPDGKLAARYPKN